MPKTNRWDCLYYAFQRVSGLSDAYLFSKIQHDGSEIVAPNLGEPWCRRSYHPSELIYALRSQQIGVITHELTPVSIYRNGQLKAFHLPDGYMEAINAIVQERTGVIANGNHAWWFRDGAIYDPDTDACVGNSLSSIDDPRVVWELVTALPFRA